MKSPSCGGKKWKLQGTGEHDATCQHQRDILEFFGQFYSPSPLQGSPLSAKKGQEVPLPRVKQAKNYCYQAIVPVLEPPHRNQGRTKQSIPCFVWITVPQKGLGAKPKESLSPKQQHFFGNRVPFTPWPWEGKCRCVCGAAQASTGTLLLSCPATVPGSSSSSSHPGQLCCRGAQGWGSGPISPQQQCQRALTARPGPCPGSQAGFAAPAEASTAPARLLTASKLSLWKLACVFLHYRAAAKARLQCRHTLYLSDPKCNFI